MKKTLLIGSSIAVVALLIMGFEGGDRKKLIAVERAGTGWHTTIYLNPNQVVGFEQAQPNTDGVNTNIYFGSPSRGVADKTIVFGVTDDYNEFKDAMEQALP
jgi:hypothetical protein